MQILSTVVAQSMTHLTALVADVNIEYLLDIANSTLLRKQNKIPEEQNRVLEMLIELMEK